MPCYAPMTAYYGRDFGPTGKRSIVFTLSAAFSPVPLRLPCGQCVGCRLERARQWAMRCVHESKMHDFNEFITLTYDNENLPAGGTLVKRDLQLFMKRLRKQFGSGIRFYACGEYGETTFRPHYHAIIFNWLCPDKKYYKDAPCGERLYTSKVLNGLWPAGNNIVGSVSFDSACYVARYVMKKVTGDDADEHYTRYDPRTGEVFSLEPEFTNMSRRPGIGFDWFRKYGNHAYEFDSCIINGLEVKPPRYYDGKFEIENRSRLEILKLNRRRKAALSRKDNTPDRRRVREVVAMARLRLKRREL